MNFRHIAEVTASAVLVFGLAALGVMFALHGHVTIGTSLIGAVIAADPDPAKQMPIAEAEITAQNEISSAQTHSDATGFFNLTLSRGLRERQITLRVAHAGYKPLQCAIEPTDRIQVLRLEPVKIETRAQIEHPDTTIAGIRIRYTVTVASTVNSGTIAKTFQAVNKGGVPCSHVRPCSPDDRWKAGTGEIALSAPEDGTFQNVRVTCIAGPCPFTEITPAQISDKGRALHIAASTWSDTATFLVEADVIRTVLNQIVRQSFPVVFGRGLSFTLPGTAAGPSIEAEENGAYTVFPLGPALHLSWAACDAKENPDTSRLYSCELKPGYRLQ